MNYLYVGIVVVLVMFGFKVVEYFIKKSQPYEIDHYPGGDKDHLEIRFKKQTTLSINGDVDFLINGDVLFANNGRLCLLSRDAIHIDGKYLFMQCRNNPLLEKYKKINEELATNDAVLLELEKEG